VVFVTPTKLQLAIFTKILDPDKLNNLMQSSTAESLALINMLTKISNSPILLKATADKAKSEGCDSMRKTSVEDALKLLPERAQIEDFSLSGETTSCSRRILILTKFMTAGKLAALSNLLKALKQVRCGCPCARKCSTLR
jgi:DNA repair and recombination protein RAD54B